MLQRLKETNIYAQFRKMQIFIVLQQEALFTAGLHTVERRPKLEKPVAFSKE